VDRPNVGTASIIRGNALDLPIADGSVDLIVTSPPYFGLRSYQDGGEHYEGQIGDEATPAEFVDALVAATAEMVRVLKPSGSIWVNLGDKYVADNRGSGSDPKRGGAKWAPAGSRGYVGEGIMPRKSLMGIPWRYALRCIDDLGLILRAEVVWSKPNGLPESVTDRVRRSHETWFHFTKSPRYFSAVDEIREEHESAGLARRAYAFNVNDAQRASKNPVLNGAGERPANPLGKLPGSVWTIPTQPLRVPDHLGIDHFAAFPMEWPRRIIRGWSPAGVCVECGEGRRPLRGRSCEECGALVEANTKTCLSCGHRRGAEWREGRTANDAMRAEDGKAGLHVAKRDKPTTVSNRRGGDVCACPEPTADTRPAIVLDPFGGTGTTALVAKALGRHGISNDMSSDYCRLATWRTNDEGELARAMQVEKPAEQVKGQASLLDLIDGGAA
jgi:DNA modification methylase